MKNVIEKVDIHHACTYICIYTKYLTHTYIVILSYYILVLHMHTDTRV